jgi:hypothetical protein
VTDLEILAKKAVKVTVGKEDRPGSSGSHQGIFLPEMRAEARNHGSPAGSASPPLVRVPIYLAFPRAEPAGLQALPNLGRALRQDSFFMQRQVRRPE